VVLGPVGRARPGPPAGGPHPGGLATTVSTVAAASGATISGAPFCHWASRNSEVGAPVSSQASGPRMVSTSFWCSQSAIASWSSSPTASAAAWTTCAAA
jgi:hypothetical protein